MTTVATIAATAAVLTPLAEAVTTIGKLAAPFLTDAEAQQYENEHISRITAWQNICNLPDSDSRADLMHGFIMRLLNDTGTPIGSLSGNQEPVPAEALNGLVETASLSIKLQRTINALQSKIAK